VCAYLFLPLDCFAGLENPFSASLNSGSSPSEEIAAHHGTASHAPCADQHDSDECNFACSCCSCISYLAPLSSEILFLATSTRMSMPEPIQRFPKVYLAIFVPPQSRC
jgi:hypothetical protein